MKWTTISTLKSSLLTNDMTHCYLCGNRATDAHHIMHGSNKQNSEDFNLIVPLCRKCHHDIHHGSGENDKKLKEEAQRAFLIEIFGKCYL